LRSAALIFGLLAGLLGGVVIALGNLESGLATVTELGSQREFLAKFIVYAIPNLGLLGAGLTLARPRLGGLLMLVSAAAWLAAAFLAGHGAVFFAALPFTFAAAGGLVALFARRPPETFISPEPQEGTSLVARHWQGAPEPRLTPPPRPRRQPAEFRREPAFKPAPLLPPEPVDEPPPPSYEDDPPDEDYIDAVESFDDDEPEPAEEPLYDVDVPLPEADEAAAEDIFGAAGIEPPAASSRRQGRWSLPEAEEPPPPRAPAARYAAERQAVPQQHQSLPQRQPPQPQRQPLTASDAPPQRRWPERPFGRTSVPDTDRNEEEFEPEEAEDELPQLRDNPLRGFLQVLILGLFIVVVIGIAVAVYLDFGRGSQSLLFGSRPHATHVATTTAPAAEPSAAPGGALVLEQPAGSASTQHLAPVALADAGSVPRLFASDTPAGAGPIAAGGVLFSDPFAYCQSVGTIDAPDAEYNGPGVPPAIATALGVPQSTPGDEVHWRCANRTVLACASPGAACAPTPTVEVMLSYCAAHPDTQNIAAPNGTWSCEGTRPVIPRDQKWPVDARGFYPGAWRQVAPRAGG